MECAPIIFLPPLMTGKVADNQKKQWRIWTFQQGIYENSNLVPLEKSMPVDKKEKLAAARRRSERNKLRKTLIIQKAWRRNQIHYKITFRYFVKSLWPLTLAERFAVKYICEAYLIPNKSPAFQVGLFGVWAIE
jgi:hypothetical protein